MKMNPIVRVGRRIWRCACNSEDIARKANMNWFDSLIGE